ncbi:MAG TPA: hypothetical protein VEQ60_16905 [Longimicrobium sp.]|nr:hypothetical protein [Longimicrobium sp.]
MEQTYRALLRGDQIVWIDAPPKLEGDTEVKITFLEPEAQEARRARGRSALAALQRLAEAGAFAEIEDPAAWEREIRQDRPLPGREE